MGFLDGIKLGRRDTAVTDTFVARITDLTAKAGIKVQKTSDDAVRAVFRVGDDRTQLVLFHPAGKLGEHPVVRILSPVADTEHHPVSGAAAIEMLKASSAMKIGSFAIWGKYLVFEQGMLLDELTPSELQMVVMAIAKTADDAEKKLTRSDAL